MALVRKLNQSDLKTIPVHLQKMHSKTLNTFNTLKHIPNNDVSYYLEENIQFHNNFYLKYYPIKKKTSYKRKSDYRILTDDNI